MNQIRSILVLTLILCGRSLFAGDQHAEDDKFWADAAALLPGFDGVPSEPQASNLSGQWGPVLDWPHVPVSAATLPDGKLLTYSGQERRTWPGTKHQTYWVIFDPVSNSFSDDNLYLDHEMFCAHLVMRTDGILQNNGGRYTVNQSSVFDWRSREWKPVDTMNDRRWYPTTVALPDGDVITVSGSGGPNTVEKFDTDSQLWNRMSGIDWQPVANAEGFESNWWPYLFVSPEGQLFHFGPTKEMHWVDPHGNGVRQSAGLTVPGDYYPKHAGVAMYESGKILVAGGAASFGGTLSTNLCYTVDLNTSPPTVEQVAPMKHARRFSNAVMLPTGEVMIVGGNTSGIKFSDQGTVLTPEIWNPKTGQWREVSDMAVARNYHSVALLLADGTVFSGGGGYGVGDLGNRNHQDGQIYTPASLFNSNNQPATRPVINSAAEEAAIGSVFEIEGSPNISKFSAIRLVATTHGLTTDLRHLSLPFAETEAGKYQIIAHPNPNVMIPGYWMLFALDSDGVYSESKIIHIKPTPQNGRTNRTNGLLGRYYDGKNFEVAKFERLDATVDFTDWGQPNSPDLSELGATNYSVQWTGWVLPETTGTYTFYATGDDGFRFFANNEPLFEDWNDHAAKELSGTIDLIEGEPMPIKLEWYQGAGGAQIQLHWSGPGIPKQIIPETNLLASSDSDINSPLSTAFLNVDDRHELYIDGKLVGIGTDWRETYKNHFAANSRTTIAIKATNSAGPASVAGEFILNGTRYYTDENWKVSTSAPANWASNSFDDSSWTSASIISERDPDIKGMPNDTLAQNIWSSNSNDKTVYLRFTVGSLAFIKPSDQTDYLNQSAQLQLSAESLNEPIVYSATELPNGLVIDPNTGLISGTPTIDALGANRVTVKAMDALLAESSYTFTWNIFQETAIDSSFNTDTEGFTYRDGAFRNTTAANYESGSWNSTAGQNGGGLKVTLGGIDNSDILNMSGGFQASFTLNSKKSVQISFSYNLVQESQYEADEYSQVLFALDGALFGSVSNNDYLAQINGDGNGTTTERTTGWVQFTKEFSDLPAGSHTLTLGGFNNKKTFADESTYIYFDSVKATILTPANEAPSLDVIDNQANTIDTNVSLSIGASDPESDFITFSAQGLPDGLVIDQATGAITGTPNTSGTFNVSVKATDTANNSHELTFVWIINQAIVFTPSPSSPQGFGNEFEYSIPVTGGTSTQYKWNFGDGTLDTAYSNSPSIKHTFSSPGRYAITVTAKDLSGLEVSARFTQNVIPAINAVRANNSQTIAYENRPSENNRIWVVNPDNDTVSVFDESTFSKINELVTGETPRSIAFSPIGDAWIVNKSSATITIIDASFATKNTFELPNASQPHGLVFNPNGGTAYVALEGLGMIAQIDIATGTLSKSVYTGQNVRGLSIDSKGEKLYVSRFITPPTNDESTLTPTPGNSGGEVLVLATSTLTLDKTITLQNSTEPDSGGGSRGIPNYLGAIAISPTGKDAWVPSKQDNIQRGVLRDTLALTHDSTVRAITSRIDLINDQEIYTSRIDHDDAAVPSAAVYGPNGLYVFVCLEASREVAVIDHFGTQELFRFPAERAPQGLTISPDGSKLFVHNFLSRSLTVHDISKITEQGIDSATLLASKNTVANEKLPAQVLLGKQHFYDAFDDRLSRSDYMSCASCHNDGGQDGRVWDLSGFGEGVRNTISLRGRGGDGHGALHWSANFDEVQDFENQIRGLSEGTGLIETGTPNPAQGAPNAGRSADLDALAAYLFSLETFAPSPFLNEDGSLTPEGEAGKNVFITKDCAACHSNDIFTDSDFGGFHDIGTIGIHSGNRLGGALSGIDTPTLRDVWATAPYLHDGSASTLEEAILAHDGLSLTSKELSDLGEFLLQLGGSTVAPPKTSSPRIVVFSSDKLVVDEGQSLTFSWTIENGGSSLTAVSIDQSVGSVLGLNSKTITPVASGSYTLTATNTKGTVTKSINITVTPAPPIKTKPIIDSFTSSSLNLNAGESITLNWAVSNGGAPITDLRIDQGIGSVLGASSISTSPTVTQTYTLSATNSEGTTTEQLVITVTPIQTTQPTINSLSLSTETIIEGERALLTWDIDNGGSALTSLQIDNGIGDVLEKVSIELSPIATTQYKLTASNLNGSVTKTVTLTVTERPTETLPLKIEAEDFDNGGSGISYLDTSPDDYGADYSGSSYRISEVDIADSLDSDGSKSVGWTEDGEWLEFTRKIPAGIVDIRFRTASPSQYAGQIEVIINGVEVGTQPVPYTGSWETWETHTLRNITIPESENTVVRIKFKDPVFDINWFEIVESNGAQAPYSEAIGMTVPGRFQIVHFDEGGEGVAYHDLDANNNGGYYRFEGVDIELSDDTSQSYSVGWSDPGEWLEYTLDVTPGNYDISLRNASGFGTPSDISLFLDGVEIAVITATPTGGWKSWKTTTVRDVQIDQSGTAVLRIESQTAGYNLNWIEFSPAGGNPGPEQTPYNSTAANIPGIVQAELYDEGPEGIAFHDTDVTNNGYNFRYEGPDIEDSGDTDGTVSLGWFSDEEWTEYTVNAEAGTYSISIRVASDYQTPGSIRLSLDEEVIHSFNVSNTGGWQTWTTLTIENIEIPTSGSKILKIEALDLGANVNWVEFTKTN